MRTKSLYGINNKSNGVSVARMYVTTYVTKWTPNEPCPPATISSKSSQMNFGKSIIPGTIGLFETHGNLEDIAIPE